MDGTVDDINAILEENDRRNRLRSEPYRPETGEGSVVGERIVLHLPYTHAVYPSGNAR